MLSILKLSSGDGILFNDFQLYFLRNYIIIWLVNVSINGRYSIQIGNIFFTYTILKLYICSLLLLFLMEGRRSSRYTPKLKVTDTILNLIFKNKQHKHFISFLFYSVSIWNIWNYKYKIVYTFGSHSNFMYCFNNIIC